MERASKMVDELINGEPGSAQAIIQRVDSPAYFHQEISLERRVICAHLIDWTLQACLKVMSQRELSALIWLSMSFSLATQLTIFETSALSLQC